MHIRSSLRQIQRLRPVHQVNYRWSSAIAAEVKQFDDAALAAAKPFESIPSFTSLPIIGTGWIYLPFFGRYDIQKQHLAMNDKRARLGNVFRENVGSLNIVISFNPEDMETMFKNEGPYPTRAGFDSLKAYRESRKKLYPNTGLLVLQGKEWHDLRSKTQKHLMKPKAIQAYMDPMQDVARDLVTKIYRVRDSNKEVPDFLHELYKWALESVAFVGLDTRLGSFEMNLPADSDGMKMINAVQTMFECMNKLDAVAGNIEFWRLFPTPMWKKFASAGDTFAELAYKYINRSLEELKKSSNEDRDLTLLQTLLLEKDLDLSGAMVMVADMLMAGIDTTSHTVGFFLYHMARNPEKQELLYQEIQRLLPQKEDRITTAVFNEFKYLKACIKESQRLMPIVGGAGRTLDRDAVIGGYRVPAGTIIAVALQAVYLDEKYFSNPLQYHPERWFQKDEKFHPFAFLPFGVGTRSCIGRRLAELEIISLLTELIKNFKIEYHYEDIGMFTRLISTPDKPLRFNFIER